MLFVVKCRYWSCRASNDPDELNLTTDRITAKAIASFGTKDLLDPEKTRKRFQAIEKKARHALEKHSRPFSGQDLTQQPNVAAQLSRACQVLKNEILNPANVSQLTGRLKRRVVLD